MHLGMFVPGKDVEARRKWPQLATEMSGVAERGFQGDLGKQMGTMDPLAVI